jgi:predicted DCC family thiol-disulfide oxidoreductase YuxK
MKALVLYDGYCALCSRIVNFIGPRQREGALEFAALQSGRGQKVLEECRLSTSELDTFVLYVDGECQVRSTGALRLMGYLRFPWPLLQGLLIVPAFLREPIYNWVAHNRFKWFGRLPGE